MGRSPCCTKEGLNRGAWTAIEDKTLIDYIKLNGEGKWRNLPKRAGLKRCGKSCRLRWVNYLRPDIKRGNITTDEEDLIIRLHNLLGNRWSLIAGRLPGRTDNEIKNYWNTRSKRVQVNETQNSIVTSPNMKSRVIRTKASKCTQVIVSPDLLSEMPTYQAPVDGGPTDLAKMASPHFNLEENRTEFTMDFKMNDKFLSDFLGDEFPPLDANEIHGSSSSDYEQTRIFTDEMLDLDSMIPFTDWLQDE